MKFKINISNTNKSQQILTNQKQITTNSNQWERRNTDPVQFCLHSPWVRSWGYRWRARTLWVRGNRNPADAWRCQQLPPHTFSWTLRQIWEWLLWSFVAFGGFSSIVPFSNNILACYKFYSKIELYFFKINRHFGQRK